MKKLIYISLLFTSVLIATPIFVFAQTPGQAFVDSQILDARLREASYEELRKMITRGEFNKLAKISDARFRQLNHLGSELLSLALDEYSARKGDKNYLKLIYRLINIGVNVLDKDIRFMIYNDLFGILEKIPNKRFLNSKDKGRSFLSASISKQATEFTTRLLQIGVPVSDENIYQLIGYGCFEELAIIPNKRFLNSKGKGRYFLSDAVYWYLHQAPYHNDSRQRMSKKFIHRLLHIGVDASSCPKAVAI